MMAGIQCEKGAVQRVAIVGAGQTGLSSIKSCLEGLTPVCFERTSFIGGLWAPHDTTIRTEPYIYSSLVFNTCKEMTCFSDFPYPKSYPTYIRQHQHYEYLTSYAKHFGLLDYIQLDTTVIEITPVSAEEDSSGHLRWRVKTKCTKAPYQEERAEIFDAVMVCNGNSSEACMVTYPNQDKFKGKFLHSCDFRDGADYKNERVVVVGGNNSAGDVAVDCCRYAKQVFLSTRDGTWPLPRLVNGGIPIDAAFNSVLGTYLPNAFKEIVFRKMISSLYNIKDIGLEPKYHTVFNSDHMVNDEIVCRILCGMVVPKPAIERFTEDGVVFSDGTHERIDTVILGTGYYSTFPFISDSIVADDPEERSLYLHMFPTSLECPSLAAIGMTFETGASLPVHEMQARYAVAVFKGDIALPNKLHMEKEVEATKRALLKELGKVKYLVPIVPYIYQLGEMMNCAPNIWRYVFSRDFKLAYCLFFKPFLPYATRLRGKHSWPGARQAIISGMDNMFAATSVPTPASQTSRVKVLMVVIVASLGIFCLHRNMEFLKSYISFI